MRWRGERESENVEDRRSEGGGGFGFPMPGGGGVRMSIGGPGAPAKASCEQIATQMVRNGLRSAACVRPA